MRRTEAGTVDCQPCLPRTSTPKSLRNPGTSFEKKPCLQSPAAPLNSPDTETQGQALDLAPASVILPMAVARYQAAWLQQSFHPKSFFLSQIDKTSCKFSNELKYEGQQMSRPITHILCSGSGAGMKMGHQMTQTDWHGCPKLLPQTPQQGEAVPPCHGSWLTTGCAQNSWRTWKALHHCQYPTCIPSRVRRHLWALHQSCMQWDNLFFCGLMLVTPTTVRAECIYPYSIPKSPPHQALLPTVSGLAYATAARPLLFQKATAESADLASEIGN